MNRTYVRSSDIRSIGFDIDILEIEFHSGGVYRYYGVPYSVYQQLMSASSHGKFFHRCIKNSYPYEKIY